MARSSGSRGAAADEDEVARMQLHRSVKRRSADPEQVRRDAVELGELRVEKDLLRANAFLENKAIMRAARARASA